MSSAVFWKSPPWRHLIALPQVNCSTRLSIYALDSPFPQPRSRSFYSKTPVTVGCPCVRNRQQARVGWLQMWHNIPSTYNGSQAPNLNNLSAFLPLDAGHCKCHELSLTKHNEQPFLFTMKGVTHSMIKFFLPFDTTGDRFRVSRVALGLALDQCLMFICGRNDQLYIKCWREAISQVAQTCCISCKEWHNFTPSCRCQPGGNETLPWSSLFTLSHSGTCNKSTTNALFLYPHLATPLWIISVFNR